MPSNDENELLALAYAIIDDAAVSWSNQPPNWYAAAERFRELYHAWTVTPPAPSAEADGVDWRAKLLEGVLTCIEDYHNGWVNKMATREKIRKLFALVPPSTPPKGFNLL
jgi:hypothetical protein